MPCPGWGPLGEAPGGGAGEGDEGRSPSCGFRRKERTRQVDRLRTGLREHHPWALGLPWLSGTCPGWWEQVREAPRVGAPQRGWWGSGSGSGWAGLHILQLN